MNAKELACGGLLRSKSGDLSLTMEHGVYIIRGFKYSKHISESMRLLSQAKKLLAYIDRHGSSDPNEYVVHVGNIGTVYTGTNGFEAIKVFNTYAGKSKRCEGMCSRENVTLLKNNEVYREFEGKFFEFEIVNHGPDGEQYFPGCGSLTPYDSVVTGIGDNEKEAYEDAVESACMTYGDLPFPSRPKGISKKHKLSREERQNEEFHWYLSIRFNVPGGTD